MTTEKIDPARAAYQTRDDQHWAELESILGEGKISLSETLINYPPSSGVVK